MIYNKNQYNQGIGKFKVLSSSAGVGSIIPTVWGGFIMPLSIKNWPMVRLFTERINAKPNDSIDQIAEESKCTLVTDQRFLNYLRSIQRLPNLRALISVPHLNLNEFNYCDYKSHPIFKRWAEVNPQRGGETDPEYLKRFLGGDDTLTIPAIVFPRWFKSGFGAHELMPIQDWYAKWKTDTHESNDHRFVPPVEARKDSNGHIITRKEKLRDQEVDVPKGYPLEQVQMVLICPNGHISDIPWDKYFSLKLAAKNQGGRLTGDDYRNLFSVNPMTCSNGQPHKLQWLPDRSNPESYGNLHCTVCDGRVSLEGIMNIRPRCCGERPWVGDPQSDNSAHEDCNQIMRWALVTSNSVYYAESFNSLYIPNDLLRDQLNSGLNDVLESMVEKQNNWQSSNQRNGNFFDNYLFPVLVSDEVDDYNSENDEEDRIIFNQGMVNSIIDAFKYGENCLSDKSQKRIFRRLSKNYGVEVRDDAVKLICVKSINNQISIADAEAVLRVFEQHSTEEMTPEKYRYDEYKVFMENGDYRDSDGKYLCFSDVDVHQMNPKISKYFSKIKQISNLAVSTTQLQFSRASSDDSEDEQHENNLVCQTIFDGPREDVKALPANQIFGEGLFFCLNEDLVREFCAKPGLETRYDDISAGDLGHRLLSQMDEYGRAKFYILHTFSHIIMKELEFTCGYPTSSLQERLYFSDRMCGVLIYTADGSEGSMGGLVAQGNPKTLERIITNAIDRAIDCSSDPLCWENKDQLNKAACFSCCMVSETSCEYGNMGLDRRALVDEFGYFSELV